MVNRLVNENIGEARRFASKWAGVYGHNEALSYALEGLLRAAKKCDLSHAGPGGFVAFARMSMKTTFIDKYRTVFSVSRGGPGRFKAKRVLHVSLQDPIGEGTSVMGDLIPDEARSAADQLLMTDSHAELRRNLEELSPRHRDVVMLYLGFNGEEPMRMEDIGKRLGLTVCGVWQAWKAALKNLKMIQSRIPQLTTKRVNFSRRVHRKPRTRRRVYLCASLLEKAKALILLGEPNRGIMRKTGMQMSTIAILRVEVEAVAGVIMCSCGRPATHRGLCRERVAANPERQKIAGRCLTAA